MSKFKCALRNQKAIWFLGAVFFVFTISCAVSLGAVSIPTKTVWSIIFSSIFPEWLDSSVSPGNTAIVWDIRIPRTLLAAMVGAGLAITGCALQSVTRNPLADPHLLGISSGGALGAVTALLHTGLFLGQLTVPLMAFLGALLAMTLVLSVVSLTRSNQASHLILTGVAVSFVVMALANLLIFKGDHRSTHTVVFWMLGGLGLAQWSHLIWPAVTLLGTAVWFFAHKHQFNAMTLGDETASALGVSVIKFRLQTFVVAALVTGVMVAFSGIIGFVGLMVPHIVRFLCGGNYAKVMPLSLLVGALFLVWSDILARTIMQPEEIPIGIVTGLIGGLFFIALLRSNKNL